MKGKNSDIFELELDFDFTQEEEIVLRDFVNQSLYLNQTNILTAVKLTLEELNFLFYERLIDHLFNDRLDAHVRMLNSGLYWDVTIECIINISSVKNIIKPRLEDRLYKLQFDKQTIDEQIVVIAKWFDRTQKRIDLYCFKYNDVNHELARIKQMAGPTFRIWIENIEAMSISIKDKMKNSIMLQNYSIQRKFN